MNTFQKQTEAVKNSPLANKIAKGFVIGIVLILALGIVTSGPVQADEDKSDYQVQIDLAQSVFDETGNAHFKAKCALAKSKQIGRAEGLEVEGEPVVWDNIIQECLGKK